MNESPCKPLDYLSPCDFKHSSLMDAESCYHHAMTESHLFFKHLLTHDKKDVCFIPPPTFMHSTPPPQTALAAEEPDIQTCSDTFKGRHEDSISRKSVTSFIDSMGLEGHDKTPLWVPETLPEPHPSMTSRPAYSDSRVYPTSTLYTKPILYTHPPSEVYTGTSAVYTTPLHLVHDSGIYTATLAPPSNGYPPHPYHTSPSASHPAVTVTRTNAYSSVLPNPALRPLLPPRLSVTPNAFQSEALPPMTVFSAASSIASSQSNFTSCKRSSDQHYSKRKYVCHVCQKRFTRPSTLQTHMNSHTGERPFACHAPGCGWRFTVLSNLKRHLKVCSFNRDH